MKKISTLIVASLLTMASFAADRRPSVTVQASKNYEVVIDGRSYSGGNFGSMTISNLRDGYHTVNVYKTNRGFFFGRNKRAVSTSSFMLRGNDISIYVDQFGQVQVNESRMGKGRDDRGWDKKDQDKGFGKDSRQGNDDHQMKDNNRHF